MTLCRVTLDALLTQQAAIDMPWSLPTSQKQQEFVIFAKALSDYLETARENKDFAHFSYWQVQTS